MLPGGLCVIKGVGKCTGAARPRAARRSGVTLDKAGYLMIPAGVLLLVFAVLRGMGPGEQVVCGLSLVALGLVLVTGKEQVRG